MLCIAVSHTDAGSTLALLFEHTDPQRSKYRSGFHSSSKSEAWLGMGATFCNRGTDLYGACVCWTGMIVMIQGQYKVRRNVLISSLLT